MPHRHGPGGLGGGAAPVFVRKNSQKIKKKIGPCVLQASDTVGNYYVSHLPGWWSCGPSHTEVFACGMDLTHPVTSQISRGEIFLILDHISAHIRNLFVPFSHKFLDFGSHLITYSHICVAPSTQCIPILDHMPATTH